MLGFGGICLHSSRRAAGSPSARSPARVVAALVRSRRGGTHIRACPTVARGRVTGVRVVVGTVPRTTLTSHSLYRTQARGSYIGGGAMMVVGAVGGYRSNTGACSMGKGCIGSVMGLLEERVSMGKGCRQGYKALYGGTAAGGQACRSGYNRGPVSTCGMPQGQQGLWGIRGVPHCCVFPVQKRGSCKLGRIDVRTLSIHTS